MQENMKALDIALTDEECAWLNLEVDRRPDRALDGTYYETAPSGRGVVDFDALLSEIKSSGYEGNLTVEFAVEQGEDITESLRSARLFFEEKLGF